MPMTSMHPIRALATALLWLAFVPPLQAAEPVRQGDALFHMPEGQ
jgi:hypothetical protein